jgi:hypothetical protein
LQYYLERNLEARERELAREEELEEKAPKVKAKSKMSKVKIFHYPSVMQIWCGLENSFILVCSSKFSFLNCNAGRENCQKEAEDAGVPTKQAKIEGAEKCEEVELIFDGYS